MFYLYHVWQTIPLFLIKHIRYCYLTVHRLQANKTKPFLYIHIYNYTQKSQRHVSVLLFLCPLLKELDFNKTICGLLFLSKSERGKKIFPLHYLHSQNATVQSRTRNPTMWGMIFYYFFHFIFHRKVLLLALKRDSLAMEQLHIATS